MSGAGLRNWRGEIVEAKGALNDGDGDKGDCEADAVGAAARSLTLNVRALASGERRPEQQKVLRKDEFGRDVEVVVDEKRRKKAKGERKEDKKEDRKEKKHKHKYKKHTHRHDKRRSRSKSPSAQGRLIGTPPPPDPFRPQLDEKRYGRSQRRQRERSLGRSRSRHDSHRHAQSRSRSPPARNHSRHHRRSSSRSRSRSRGRDRSRSPPSSRSRRRRSSASVERKWTHNAFDDRSPSPPRQVDPLYRPDPENWVSRAGGVYLPRK